MAKITTQTFTVESFKDQGSWIGKLFGPLNSFISQVVLALNNRLTIQDNLFQELKSIEFVNESTNFPVKFTTKFNKFPQIVLVGSCIDSDGGYPSVQPLLNWTFKDNYLIINSISGLTASNVYTLKLLIIYE